MHVNLLVYMYIISIKGRELKYKLYMYIYMYMYMLLFDHVKAVCYADHDQIGNVYLMTNIQCS